MFWKNGRLLKYKTRLKSKWQRLKLRYLENGRIKEQNPTEIPIATIQNKIWRQITL
jgi:hypothetical protein